MNKNTYLSIACLSLLTFNPLQANEVQIVAADFTQATDHSWIVKVTLKHQDTGWDHYADGWKIVDATGNELGNRILHHPHVQEQPFTRNLVGIVIPKTVGTVYIEAHDKVHGWTKNRLSVDLSLAKNGHLTVQAVPVAE